MQMKAEVRMLQSQSIWNEGMKQLQRRQSYHYTNWKGNWKWNQEEQKGRSTAWNFLQIPFKICQALDEKRKVLYILIVMHYESYKWALWCDKSLANMEWSRQMRRIALRATPVTFTRRRTFWKTPWPLDHSADMVVGSYWPYDRHVHGVHWLDHSRSEPRYCSPLLA